MSHDPSLMVRLLTANKGKAPLMLKRVVMRSMSAKLAANFLSKLPPEDFREIALRESINRVAKLAVHLDPQEMREAYLKLPDTFHLKLTHELCSDGLFATAAGFSELLSARQLKVLFFAVNDVSHVVHVIKHIKNVQLVVQSVRNCSTDYLCQLTEKAVVLGDTEASANLLGHLPMHRQVDVCANLPPAVLIPLMPQLLPINDHQLSQHLPPKLMAALYGQT